MMIFPEKSNVAFQAYGTRPFHISSTAFQKMQHFVMYVPYFHPDLVENKPRMRGQWMVFDNGRR